jgi:GT2 family glycosyltransferase
MTKPGKVAVIVVSFRNPADVVTCLRALEKCDNSVPFEVFISENGGSEAYSALINRLSQNGHTLIVSGEHDNLQDTAFNQVDVFLAIDGNFHVILGESKENLGYAGGINAWLRRLRDQGDWLGFWILNPDTFPDANALVEMVRYAEIRGRGMVGSRLLSHDHPEINLTRGLIWSFWGGRTVGVDNRTSAAILPDPIDVEKRIDSPSGASFYITSDCVRRIGLMDECYFLYFEDFDWGLRAKAACGIGYALNSKVFHIGGTTLGSASSRRRRSQLSVYLDFRNRLLFVRRHYPGWYPWTVAVVLVRSLEFVAVGALTNFRAALAGWSAGVRGETGRPDRLMNRLFGGAKAAPLNPPSN